MLPRVWPPDDLDVARELAEVALLHLTLDVVVAVIRHHHPLLDDDYRPADPDDLLVARRLVVAALELRGLLDRYRVAVRRAPEFARANDDVFARASFRGGGSRLRRPG